MIDGNKLSGLITPEELPAFLEQNSEMIFLDADTEGRLNDRETGEWIKALCHLIVTTEFFLLPVDLQSEYLRRLQQERCSIRQLVLFFEVW